jgi:hypothetical protein
MTVLFINITNLHEDQLIIVNNCHKVTVIYIYNRKLAYFRVIKGNKNNQQRLSRFIDEAEVRQIIIPHSVFPSPLIPNDCSRLRIEEGGPDRFIRSSSRFSGICFMREDGSTGGGRKEKRVPDRFFLGGFTQPIQMPRKYYSLFQGLISNHSAEAAMGIDVVVAYRRGNGFVIRPRLPGTEIRILSGESQIVLRLQIPEGNDLAFLRDGDIVQINRQTPFIFDDPLKAPGTSPFRGGYLYSVQRPSFTEGCRIAMKDGYSNLIYADDKEIALWIKRFHPFLNPIIELGHSKTRVTIISDSGRRAATLHHGSEDLFILPFEGDVIQINDEEPFVFEFEGPPLEDRFEFSADHRIVRKMPKALFESYLTALRLGSVVAEIEGKFLDILFKDGLFHHYPFSDGELRIVNSSEGDSSIIQFGDTQPFLFRLDQILEAQRFRDRPGKLEEQDCLEILGLSEDEAQDPKKLKSTFRELSKKYHPDRHRGDSEKERIFKLINGAYQFLQGRQ